MQPGKGMELMPREAVRTAGFNPLLSFPISPVRVEKTKKRA